ncbi:phosphate ABC transporter permease PstA [Taklimakanibacter lacteus]|uniref:phosphate ABC transporter permease PstA n=1 Tax=Taklimakanibacter lacteus TaxID=2268456 RepID=UPI000E6737E5
MTDTAIAAPRRFSDNDALVAKRYRAERRFKLYGIAAIAVTAIFLVLLFADILARGLPAFFESRIDLSVKVDQAAIDPQNSKDPKVIRTGDFDTPVRDSFRALFPEVTSRADRKKLLGLLSSGAADDFRKMVMGNPGLIGQDAKVPVLLSDDADQYMKGRQTGVERIKPIDGLTIKQNGENYTLSVVSPESVGFKIGDIVRANGGALRISGPVETDKEIPAETVTAPKSLDPVASGAWDIVRFTVPESSRRIDDQEALWLEQLKEQGVAENGIAWRFFSSGDSREPELAGIRGALMGSILTLLVTLFLCLPIGVAAAIYLEEFAPKNRLTQLIEVNINNLAAVPSIVFGLLGLAMFLNFFGLPRSAPLVGGLVLALLVLPTIIIAARAALRAVPPSIKEAALGVGASHQQAIFHHVLPLAMPGIMTGTIIGMAHALGETAPLLMIGMVAFIVDVPAGFTDAAAVLPIQIYLWSDLPEIAFQSKTAGAIIVLLVFLFVMNAAAILLRKRFERRW